MLMTAQIAFCHRRNVTMERLERLRAQLQPAEPAPVAAAPSLSPEPGTYT